MVAGVLEKFARLTVYSGEHLGGFGYKKTPIKNLTFCRLALEVFEMNFDTFGDVHNGVPCGKLERKSPPRVEHIPVRPGLFFPPFTRGMDSKA